MPAPSKLFVGAAAAVTVDGVTAGSVAAAATLITSDIEPRSLSARFVVDAETNTITLSAVWQVSDDASSWTTIRDPNNTVPTVLATGTGGADASVTVAIAAPFGVYGWRYVRAGVLVGVATGTSSDSATVAYRYAKPGF